MRSLVVPLFPLPNVVLFPRAVLPLHIFEERYRAMVADAVTGEKRIAMALLRPAWEHAYHAQPPVEPVVCVGTILAHERLADGRYNLLLKGERRARIAREVQATPYRAAEVEPLVEPAVPEPDLSEERRRLASLFTGDRGVAAAPLAAKFREMLASAVATADVADLAAFNLVEDVSLKQQLLAEPDPRRRVQRLTIALHRLATPTGADLN